jgi:hypothetical protein
MIKSLKRSEILLAVVLAMVCGRTELNAFTLLGPFATWQNAAIGFDLQVVQDESGGPMNLAEEYRLNVPELTYGFDSTYLNYFGTKGVAAIDEAFAILNGLPTANSIDLANFPLQAKAPINFTAANLNILDLKSHVLGLMVAQLGIGNSHRYTWCLRNRATLPGGQISYLVIQRNFDPVTYGYTNSVNGTIYTYSIFDPIRIGTVTYSDAVERPIDPAADDFTTLGGIDSPDPFRGVNLSPGENFTGLTKDDAAALRYIYRSDNFNVEDLTGGVTLSTNPVNRSPFNPIGGSNTFTTNTLMGLALRPGIGKVSFRKIGFDSILGTTLSYTNDYLDTFVTNNIVNRQRLERVITVPDIVFVADDLGIVNTVFPEITVRSIANNNWIDHSSDNTVGATGTAGPGVIVPSITIAFSKLGPSRLNQTPFFLDENNFVFSSLIFGHFDTRNIFAVFPDGSSVASVEATVGTTSVGVGVSPF